MKGKAEVRNNALFPSTVEKKLKSTIMIAVHHKVLLKEMSLKFVL